jgi:hypothetical protein
MEIVLNNREITHLETTTTKQNVLLGLHELLLQLMITIAHICVDPKASPANTRMLAKTLEAIQQLPLSSLNYF